MSSRRWIRWRRTPALERASDFEGQWVVLPPQQGKDEFLFGFVYIDPQAGFTLR